MTASEPHFMQAQLHLKEAHTGVAARVKTEIGDGSIAMDYGPVGSENLPGS